MGLETWFYGLGIVYFSLMLVLVLMVIGVIVGLWWKAYRWRKRMEEKYRVPREIMTWLSQGNFGKAAKLMPWFGVMGFVAGVLKKMKTSKARSD